MALHKNVIVHKNNTENFLFTLYPFQQIYNLPLYFIEKAFYIQQKWIVELIIF